MFKFKIYRQYSVLYNDGQRSIPMTKGVAKDYAAIFGGKVIKEWVDNPYHIWR